MSFLFFTVVFDLSASAPMAGRALPASNRFALVRFDDFKDERVLLSFLQLGLEIFFHFVISFPVIVLMEPAPIQRCPSVKSVKHNTRTAKKCNAVENTPLRRDTMITYSTYTIILKNIILSILF